MKAPCSIGPATSEVGVGRMTVTESKPDEHIKIRIDFEEPWAGDELG